MKPFKEFRMRIDFLKLLMDKIQKYFILLIFLITFCFAYSARAEDYKISEGKDSKDSVDIIDRTFQQITSATYASLNKVDSDVTEEASRDSLRTITRMPQPLVGYEWSRFRRQYLQASPGKFELFRCENLRIEAPTFDQRSSLTDSDDLPKWYEMITNVPGDLWNFTKAEYKSPNVPVYLLLAGTTAGLIITDDQTYTSSHKFYLKKQFNKHMSDLFAEAGNGRTQFSLAACFAAYGFISDDHRALRTASEIVEAVLAAGTVVQVIKHITGREDPVRASSPGGTWRFFPDQREYLKEVPKYDAFPSGHLATSIATFVVVAKNYPEYSNWITPVSVALSTLISIGMVNNGIHWYSDYPLAIAIGYTFGKQISNRNNNRNNENKEGTNKLALVPFFDSQNLGLSVKLSF